MTDLNAVPLQHLFFVQTGLWLADTNPKPSTCCRNSPWEHSPSYSKNMRLTQCWSSFVRLGWEGIGVGNPNPSFWCWVEHFFPREATSQSPTHPLSRARSYVLLGHVSFRLKILSTPSLAKEVPWANLMLRMCHLLGAGAPSPQKKAHPVD